MMTLSTMTPGIKVNFHKLQHSGKLQVSDFAAPPSFTTSHYCCRGSEYDCYITLLYPMKTIDGKQEPAKCWISFTIATDSSHDAIPDLGVVLSHKNAHGSSENNHIWLVFCHATTRFECVAMLPQNECLFLLNISNCLRQELQNQRSLLMKKKFLHLRQFKGKAVVLTLNLRCLSQVVEHPFSPHSFCSFCLECPKCPKSSAVPVEDIKDGLKVVLKNFDATFGLLAFVKNCLLLGIDRKAVLLPSKACGSTLNNLWHKIAAFSAKVCRIRRATMKPVPTSSLLLLYMGLAKLINTIPVSITQLCLDDVVEKRLVVQLIKTSVDNTHTDVGKESEEDCQNEYSKDAVFLYTAVVSLFKERKKMLFEDGADIDFEDEDGSRRTFENNSGQMATKGRPQTRSLLSQEAALPVVSLRTTQPSCREVSGEENAASHTTVARVVPPLPLQPELTMSATALTPPAAVAASVDESEYLPSDQDQQTPTAGGDRFPDNNDAALASCLPGGTTVKEAAVTLTSDYAEDCLKGDLVESVDKLSADMVSEKLSDKLEGERRATASSSNICSDLLRGGLQDAHMFPPRCGTVKGRIDDTLLFLQQSSVEEHQTILSRFLEEVSAYSETLLLSTERILVDITNYTKPLVEYVKKLHFVFLAAFATSGVMRGDYPRPEREVFASVMASAEGATGDYKAKEYEKGQIFHKPERERRQLINIICMGALNPEDEGRPILKVLFDQLIEFTGVRELINLLPPERNFTRQTLIGGYRDIGRWLNKKGWDEDVAMTCVLTAELLVDDASQEAVLRAAERVRHSINTPLHRVLDCLYQLAQAHIRVAQTKKSGFAYNSSEIHMHSKKAQRFQEALVLAAANVNPTTKYNCLLGIGQCYSLLEQYASALEAYDHCSDVASMDEEKKMHYYIVEGQLGSGEVHLLLDQHLKALEKFNQALDSCGKLHGKESSLTALKVKVLNKIGSVQRTLGQSHYAVETHERALCLAKDIDSAVGIANSACPLGNIYQSMGNAQMTCKYYEEQYLAAKRTGDYSMMAWAAGNFGNGKLAVRDLVAASQYLEEALKIAEMLHDPIEIGRASNNLGNIHLARREYEQALRLFRKACQTAIDTQDNTGQMRACGNIGNIYMSLNQPIVAHEWYRIAFSLSRQAGDEVSEGNAHYNIGRASLACYEKDKKDGLMPGEHHLEDAESNFLKSAQIFNLTYEDIGTSSSGESLKTSLFHSSVKVYRQLQYIHTLHGRYEKVLEYSERSRAMAFNEYMMQRLECRLAGVNEDLGRVPPPLSSEEIKQLVAKQHAVVLIYAICRGDLQIWHVDPHRSGEITFRSRTICKGDRASSFDTEQKLQREVVSALHTFVRPELLFMQSNGDLDEDMPTRLAALYDKLIQPVRDLLPEPSIGQEIVFVPSRVLLNVPFSALFDGQSGMYLSQQYPLRIIPTCRLLNVPRPPTVLRSPYDDISSNSTLEAVVIGNPEIPFLTSPDGECWKPSALMHAEQEAIHVARVCGALPLLGVDATKKAVLEKMATAQVIHLATHGTTDGSILLATDKDTGQLLSDEIYEACVLGPDEVSRLKLRATLVVLSACDSGRGSKTAAGPVALGRAFLVAGAQAVLVSFIPIQDQPTKILMRAFYHLLQFGWTASLALHYAMHQVSAFMRYTPPHYWASFHLLGHDICVNIPAIRLQSLPYEWGILVPRGTSSDLPLAFPRQDVFEKIFNAWFCERSSASQLGPKLICLSGGEGLGKTVTAIVVASYFKQLFPQREVVWLSAKSEGSLLLSFQRAAKQLKLKDSLSSREAVMKWLCDSAARTGWLLILDGVDDPSLSKCLPLCLLRNNSAHPDLAVGKCFALSTSRCPLLSTATHPWTDIRLWTLTWDQSVEMMLHLTCSSFPAPELTRGDKVHLSLVCRPKVVGGLPAVIDGLAALVDEGRVVSFTDLFRQLPSVQSEDVVPAVLHSNLSSLFHWPLLPEDRVTRSCSSVPNNTHDMAETEAQAASNVSSVHTASALVHSAAEHQGSLQNVADGHHPAASRRTDELPATVHDNVNPPQMTIHIQRADAHDSRAKLKHQGWINDHGQQVLVQQTQQMANVDGVDGPFPGCQTGLPKEQEKSTPPPASGGSLFSISGVANAAVTSQRSRGMLTAHLAEKVEELNKLGLECLLKADERECDQMHIESAARVQPLQKGSITERHLSYLHYGRLKWFAHDLLASIQDDLQQGLPEGKHHFRPGQGLGWAGKSAATASGPVAAAAAAYETPSASASVDSGVEDSDTLNNPVRTWLLNVREAIGWLPLPLDYVIESALDSVALSDSIETPVATTRRATEGSVLTWLSLLGMIDILSVHNAYTNNLKTEYDNDDATIDTSSTFEVSKFTAPFSKLLRPDKEQRKTALLAVALRLLDLLQSEVSSFDTLRQDDTQHLLLTAADLCEHVTKLTPPVDSHFATVIGQLCETSARLLCVVPAFSDINSSFIDEVMPKVKVVLSQGCDESEFAERKRLIQKCEALFHEAKAKHTTPHRVQVVPCVHNNILLFSKSYQTHCSPLLTVDSSNSTLPLNQTKKVSKPLLFDSAEGFVESLHKQRKHLCKFCPWRNEATTGVLLEQFGDLGSLSQLLLFAESLLGVLQVLHKEKKLVSMGYWSVTDVGLLVGPGRVQLLIIDSDLINSNAPLKMAGNKEVMAADLKDFGDLLKKRIDVLPEAAKDQDSEMHQCASDLANICYNCANHVDEELFGKLLQHRAFASLQCTTDKRCDVNDFFALYKPVSKAQQTRRQEVL